MERQGGSGQSMLVGSSKPMRGVRALLERLAEVPWPVRIEGPTGSGKGLAARVLHDLSPRRGKPFISLNLNMLAVGLEIAELVGHVRGAFTGAVADRAGAMELAHGGTLFLDEIAAASLLVQRALLQLLEESSVRRLGEQRVRPVDVRLVFASNVDVERAVREGSFRQDLYYRLGRLVVSMPPLADHLVDVPELVAHILARKSRELGTPIPDLGPHELAAALRYRWPGNVRELDRALEHWAAFGALPDAVVRGARAVDWRCDVDAALDRHGGNKTAAARELGVSRETLQRELKRRKA